jgi:murein DD-endopeptidase MepM/ murein hydrolase activator NlpD
VPEPTVRFAYVPVAGWISGNFGDWYGNRQHRGTDIACNEGTPVYAPASGTIVAPYNDGSYGIAVCIQHEDGWHTLYAHLSQAAVGYGDWVRVGDLLGYSGNTGMSTGPHLHWQLSDSYRFLVDISHSRDAMAYIAAYPEVDDMTEAEVRALIQSMKDSGEIASTTDVLACVCQISGSEENTYSDVARVEGARVAMGNLPSSTGEGSGLPKHIHPGGHTGQAILLDNEVIIGPLDAEGDA